MDAFYSSLRWRRLRRRALERDGNRCTVSRLLGGDCSPGSLHAHHVVPISEGGAPLDLDNVGTSCPGHHPQWEALRRTLVGRRAPQREEPVECRHFHPTREAREICERRMARRRARAIAA
jgi:5-methylcytosine-specific restriction endonuclease McrA